MVLILSRKTEKSSIDFNNIKEYRKHRQAFFLIGSRQI